MCLAIYKPAGTEIPLKNLENGFQNHDDGAGMAWAVNGVLHVRKGMLKIEEVLEQYEKIKSYPALIHFRKATHGKVDAANCHPFLFNDNKLALIHNGVLKIKCHVEGLSDTAHFVKFVLEPMVKIHKVPINDGVLFYLVSTSIGSDKMAVMDGKGKCFIFNESKGEWEGGVWYSNTSFRYAYSYKANTNYSSSGGDFKNHPYFQGTGRSSKRTEFRKHWEDDDAGDETYLEFWKRTAAAERVETGRSIGFQSPKTTRLLGPPKTDRVDDAGNVVTAEVVDVDEVTVEDVERIAAPQYSEGQMCEYGWFDAEVEASIEQYQLNLGLSREEAIIRIYNEKA